MANYKKSFDRILKFRIEDCWKIYNTSDKVRKIFTEVMKNWNKKFYSRKKHFSRGENPEGNLSGRYTIAIAI